jgi:hypothetical protein
MKKHFPIIIGILGVILIIGTVFLIYQKQKTATVEKSTTGQTVEDLIKQSAAEMVDPSLATAQTDKPKTVDDSISDTCISAQTQTFSCYQDYYAALVRRKGVTVAFADLRARYDLNAYIKSQCHPITHVIGSTAAQIYLDVGTAYTKGDSFCWSGYYHGVLEGIIGQITPSDLEKKMDSICAKIPGKSSYSFDYYNCVHGLGHGVMAISQNELFDSLKLCDAINGSWEQQSCYGGAFMENVIVDNKNHFTKYLKLSEPLYPCTAVDDKYKHTCYLMQTSYMLKATNGDFTKVFELCSTVGNFASTCYQSLGRDASGRSISNVELTKATCNLGKDYDQKSNCIIGAVKDFVSYYHSDVQAKQLCTSLATDLQAICNSTVESYYTTFK